MVVFNRRVVRRHRDRAAARLAEHDFLFREVAERLCDRLDDMKRRFPLALDLGCHAGAIGRAFGDRGGIETLVQCDLSIRMAARAREAGRPGALTLAADEEFLSFKDASFDLVLSCLSLHWVNDLPGALLQARRALKPDGLFLAALFGGETLKELRQALTEAEIAVEGGLSPRVSPFADVRDLGGLLQRAGFALPVVDGDTIMVSYGDPLTLMADLRAMGESDAGIHRRRGFTRRRTLTTAAERYRALFGDAEGRVPATFQVIYLTAWAPHESQQKPLKPGSATARLADALGTTEIPAGDKARP
jgi:SAM-dependent methyltransferase